MIQPWDGVDWSRLIHAFGPAANLPDRLAAWLGPDLRDKIDGETYLHNACFAFGLWPATIPTATVLARLLDEGDLDTDAAESALLFLHKISGWCDLGPHAEALRARCEQHHAEDVAAWTAGYAAADPAAQETLRTDPLRDLVHDRSRLAGFGLMPELITTVTPYLTDERITRRGWIAATIATLASHPDAADRRAALATLVEQAAWAQSSDRELATMLIALGDLGGTPRAWLDHEHFGVRASAALAESLAGDSAAQYLRAELANSPQTYFGSFGPGLAPLAQFVKPPYDCHPVELLQQRL